MKNRISLFIILSLIVLSACTNNTKKEAIQQDTIVEKTIPLEPISETIETVEDSVLETTKKILTSLKNKDYETLATFIHPNLGLTFSPYGFIDTTKSINFSKNQFVNKVQQQKTINWGAYDGSGDPILLTPENYFKKFVYSADFLKADTTSKNKIISKGNSLINLNKVFKDCDFTESYFAGFNKKYDGMDWQSLILVYKKSNNQNKLVAIIHNQWTI
ncbi:hypothetical protein [Pedobacter alpinus]|uniref:Lipoprotein n=1 Tax=Pedobacter alpinus TaxID=1590643 RepID=A0ABW5TMQ1_9SPHI